MSYKPLTIAFALALALIPLAANAGEYIDLPAEKGSKSSLKVKFVRYTGGTNGHIVVDIKNGGKAEAKFQAQGLYFVPNGSPESAPQRLGAAGPFQTQEQGKWKDKEELSLKAGESRRIKLQVFCLDSHRSSPGSEQGFSVARDLLPRDLRKDISKGAEEIFVKNGKKMPAAKGAIQSHIWSTRNKKWIKLQGERKQEKSVERRSQGLRNRIQRRISNEIQQQVQEIK